MQGTVVDERYVLGESLGRGGMGQVYLAHDDLLDRDVALKLLNPQHAENPRFVERFRREAKNVAALSHPNIVSVFDAGEDAGGVPYMAMEYVGGGTLAQKIEREGPLDALEAAGIALQVAHALEEAHRGGVVHRDIKPHNIFLVEEGSASITSSDVFSAGSVGADPGGLAPGSVKVGDFGIARATAETAMTETSLVLGTVRYFSPEQATGEEVGPSSDRYSLGVVLYEMLTGEVPFDAENPIAIAMKHVSEPPPSPRRKNPGVPEGLQTITLRLLAKDPERRYADTGDLVEDLGRAARGLPPASLPAENETELLGRLSYPVPAPALYPTRGRGRRGFVAPRRARFRRRLGTVLVLSGFVGVLALAGSGGGFSALYEVSGARETGQLVNGVREIPRSSGLEVPVVLASVPDVVGESRERAEGLLRNAGFEVDVSVRETLDQQGGTVMSQDPRPGDRVERGSRVTLTVAEAPATVAMPDLTGLSVPEAETVLTESGLVLGSRAEAPSDTMPAGLILDQEFSAGEEVAIGAGVDVTVSSGPPAPAAAPQPAPAPAAAPQPAPAPTPQAPETLVPETPQREPQEAPPAEAPLVEEPRTGEPEEEPRDEEPQAREPRESSPDPSETPSPDSGTPEGPDPNPEAPVLPEPVEPINPDSLGILP